MSLESNIELIPIIIPKIKPPNHDIIVRTIISKYSTGIETSSPSRKSFIEFKGLSKDTKIKSPKTPVKAME
jgi:hypothetical protein